MSCCQADWDCVDNSQTTRSRGKWMEEKGEERLWTDCGTPAEKRPIGGKQTPAHDCNCFEQRCAEPFNYRSHTASTTWTGRQARASVCTSWARTWLYPCASAGALVDTVRLANSHSLASSLAGLLSACITVCEHHGRQMSGAYWCWGSHGYRWQSTTRSAVAAVAPIVPV